MRERLSKEPVGQPWVPRKQRSVEICPDRAAAPAALEAGLAVVPEPVENPSERDTARIEQRPTSVVLETGELVCQARLELALEQDVADHARRSGDGLVGEEAHAGHERPVAATVAAAEQLVAAAYGKQCDTRRMRELDRLGLRDEVGSNESLLAILATADVKEVERIRFERVSDADSADVELVAAERRTSAEN
jgi:hypothetical protein